MLNIVSSSVGRVGNVEKLEVEGLVQLTIELELGGELDEMMTHLILPDGVLEHLLSSIRVSPNLEEESSVLHRQIRQLISGAILQERKVKTVNWISIDN